ncbi:alpha/beta hydrolase [Sciscionella marina]|uniref:alpha/beta hydrolase n=1 Tax=Sciscionella marina TaxID=508770 RepID=UPI0003647322|nr:alpha/beta fold hydrolase [Sciscionella marina]
MSGPTFVFVHGSNSNSYTWAPLLRELALRGHRGLAVDLPGHGPGAAFSAAYQAPQDLEGFAGAEPVLSRYTFADTIEHVTGVVRRAVEHGPVILAGHSRGGLALTGVGNAVPELLSRIVYIGAWCCVDGTVEDYQSGPEHANSALNDTAGVLLGDPATLGVLRMNWRTADPGLLAALRAAMLADGSMSELLAYLNTLEPDESLDGGGELGKADLANWGRIPRSYIRLAGDRSLPLALQDRFIAEADAHLPENPFEVRTLESSHVGFLIRPARAAELLAYLAG